MPSIGKFRFVVAIDLVIGYNSFDFDKEAKKVCVIVLPWGLFCYSVLPMGLTISLDVFQEALGRNLFLNLEYIQVYLIMIGNDVSFGNHMAQVGEVLSRLMTMRLRMKPRKSFWA